MQLVSQFFTDDSINESSKVVENFTGNPDGKPGIGFICTPTMKP